MNGELSKKLKDLNGTADVSNPYIYYKNQL